MPLGRPAGSNMAEEHKIGPMAIPTQENGSKVKCKELERSCMPTKMYMKVNISRIKPMAMVFIHVRMVNLMKATLLKIGLMVKVNKYL